MKNTIRSLCFLVLLLVPLLGLGQTVTTTTTLTAAITDPAATRVSLASLTGITATNTALWVDHELMFVNVINATALTADVTRGYAGTRATTHANSATVTLGPPNYVYIDFPFWGSCTAANEVYLPHILTEIGGQAASASGYTFDCFGSTWQVNDNIPRYTLTVAPQAQRSALVPAVGNVISLTAQAGGANLTSAGTGAAGGAASLTGGAGGAASTGAATGGAGGAASLVSGAGGGTITGGAGGLASVTAGNGANGSTAGGAGGGVTITAGNAGTGGTPAGGVITLVPGIPTSTGATGFVVIAGAAAGAHLATTQTTIPAASGTCTTPAVAANSTDTAGQVSSASCTADQTLIATFNKAWGTAPFCVCSPANVAASVTASAGAITFCSASTTALTLVTPHASTTAGAWNYVCFGKN